MEIIDIKTTISEILKSSLDDINSQLATTGEKISEFEDITIESIQTEAERKKTVKNEQLSRMKRQVTDCEKIFAKDIYEKGLLPKIHEELIKLNNKKMNLI